MKAALVMLSQCGNPQTGEIFPAVMTEEYVGHQQLEPMAVNVHRRVLVTPKAVRLMPGSLVDVGGVPWPITTPCGLDPHKTSTRWNGRLIYSLCRKGWWACHAGGTYRQIGIGAVGKGIASTVTIRSDSRGENAEYYASREDYATRNHKERPDSGWLASPRGSYANRGHAFGLDRVPYDECPALLHEGERVLTAAQARAQDAGQGGGGPVQLTITGNSFVGTSEEMAEQIWAVIVRRLEQEAVARAPK